ncbi:MAG: polyphosphate kinase 1 [Gemmatimonadota bacterium]
MIIRRFVAALPDAGAAAEAFRSLRVLGLFASPPRISLVRETYFDTSAGLLRSMGATLCWQTGASHDSILLTTTRSVDLEGIMEESRLSQKLDSPGAVYATLAGAGEVADRIRELTDPAALRPLVALDVERVERGLSRLPLFPPRFRLRLDALLVQGRVSEPLRWEMSVEASIPSAEGLHLLARRAGARWRARTLGGTAGARALDSKSPVQAAGAPSAPAPPRLALLLLDGEALALVPGPSGLTLPSTLGSGEAAAERFSTSLLPTPAGDRPRLVGFTSFAGEEGTLELWLQEGPSAEISHAAWVPLPELLLRCGAPGLDDDLLRGALQLFSTSEAGMRLLKSFPAVSRPSAAFPPLDFLGDARRNEAHPPFLDPDLSLLDFNRRVLEMAEDERIPLLERLAFLGILAGNQDEFFMVRAGRLKVRAAHLPAHGNGAAETRRVLDFIGLRSRALEMRAASCLHGTLLPALAARGRALRKWDQLTASQRETLAKRFRREVLPLLTPRSLSVTPGQPFPRLENLRMSLAVRLAGSEQAPGRFAEISLPPGMPRFLPVPGSEDFLLLEDLLCAQIGSLFPDRTVLDAFPFRVTRLGELDVDEAAWQSILPAMEGEVGARPFLPVVRLEVAEKMPRDLRIHLLQSLREENALGRHLLAEDDVYEVHGMMDAGTLVGLRELLEIPGGRWPPFEPRPTFSSATSPFRILDEGDVLVHHPYDDFDSSVVRFLGEAARDPQVVSIKLTLYRTEEDSEIAAALLEAAAKGKDVTVFVELKARFDEERNIAWTRRLTDGGVHVMYGIVGYKTHAKTALVVRRDDDGVPRRYSHIGTGNYNAGTARFYTDLGLFTADADIGAELADFFNHLTASQGPPDHACRLLWVAPHQFASNLLRRIQREEAHARGGRAAGIRAKLNGLSDREVIRALYRASDAGVAVDLVVRGLCTLRPGVPGLSEGIRVRSVLGRFLEHSRIYAFENGGAREYYIGSADWRERNLRHRVEVAVPVLEPRARDRLEAILSRYLDDPRAWVLRPDGTYRRLQETGASAQKSFFR